ncbi:MAG: glycoside hydrolase family 3 protein [Anaerolineae bacterium]|jgi:beta-glucosidase|nr:glycoside hydrolase family 3 protein [Chloroflexota bacterium]
MAGLETSVPPDSWRDLNKNGRLDPYEDPRRPVAERVEDLLGQMTLEEKAGLMFHTMLGANEDGTLAEGVDRMGRQGTSEMVLGRHMNHFNMHALPSPRLAAQWYNRLQALAESTRLGIPITLSSDPRHAFSNDVLTAARASGNSQWPEPIGLAAIGDPDLVEQFADIARQEYLATGLRVALHPMADLATEPRWGRISGTFGEDAALSSRLTAAYIRGFQGETLGPDSVACMTKHFPGGGPQLDGLDAHFPWGKEQVYPGGAFDYHLIPFEAAFAAGTSQIMPYYGQPIGLEGIEEVGFSFNKAVITGLLRERYGFDGIVCTDWGLLVTREFGGTVMEARAWGVEGLSTVERAVRCLEAGVDQFGGEACPEVIVEAVRAGLVSEARIDTSVRRLLREKFVLGLFDNPYVDPDQAEAIVGRSDFVAAGAAAQRRSLTLLKNGADQPVLPLRGRPRLYLEKVAPEAAAAYGEVVESPAEADFILLRMEAPFEPREGFLESRIHAGRLDLPAKERQRLLALMAQAPTIVCIHLDRPAVIPEVAAASVALLGEYGASDDALLDVVFGRAQPEGRLPFELPSSMEAVEAQAEDLPHDSADPLFPFGFGLRY